jgi:hypothetical protein
MCKVSILEFLNPFLEPRPVGGNPSPVLAVLDFMFDPVMGGSHSKDNLC